MGGKSSSSSTQDTNTNTEIKDERIALADGSVSASRGGTVSITAADAGALETANIAVVASAAADIEKAKSAERAERDRIKAQSKRDEQIISFASDNSEEGFALATTVANSSFEQVEQNFQWLGDFVADGLSQIREAQESAFTGAGEYANQFADNLTTANATENERNFDRINSTIVTLAVIGAGAFLIRKGF